MINAHCHQPGTLEVGGRSQVDGQGFDHSGAHAAYSFDTPEQLHRRASQYQWVQRPNGKTEKGSNYTLRKAQNDFKI